MGEGEADGVGVGVGVGLGAGVDAGTAKSYSVHTPPLGVIVPVRFPSKKTCSGFSAIKGRILILKNTPVDGCWAYTIAVFSIPPAHT